MARRHFLITYDIADDKRRTRLFKKLRDNGEHVQYSVFLCELSLRELATLKGEIDALIHHREDQVLLLDMGPCDDRPEPLACMQFLGKAFTPTTRVLVV